MKKGFTLIEVIFVVVLIGILSAVALPKFTGMRDNAKIASELSIAESVQTAIEACHGEWIVNDGPFVCGKDIDSTDETVFDRNSGYPLVLGSDDAHPLDRILKHAERIQWIRDSAGHYRGPASNGGVEAKTPDIPGKPDADDYWEYDTSHGTFRLIDR
ncbi:type II secretion system protein [Hydrogenimonas sp.]